MADFAEMVEIESYYEDAKKLEEELSDAESKLKQERERGKGREQDVSVGVSSSIIMSQN